MKQTDSSKDILQRILRLAWPAILTNISVPLLGLSDTFISGHIGDVRFLAAIAVATTMVNTLYWLFGFLRMGTTGLTATAYGAGDNAAQAGVFTRSLILALSIGICLILASAVLADAMLLILDPPAEAAGPAREYFFINLLGAPALLATMSATGRLIGRQNTVYPMIISIAVNVINIILSMLLVFVFDSGFKGVAIGTTTANWLGFILAMTLVKIQSKGVQVLVGIRRAFKGGGILKFFSVNGFLFARSACMIAVTFAMTAYASRMGTLPLAVNAVMMQFFLFFSYFMDGFAFSAEALCGEATGRRDRSMLTKTIRELLLAGTFTTIIFAGLYGGLAPEIASLLSDSPEVVRTIDGLRTVTILLPVASVMAFIFDGVYIGLTHASMMLLSTLSGMLLFFGIIEIHTALAAPLTQPLLWTAFLVFLFARGAVLGLALPHSTRLAVDRQPEIEKHHTI